MEVGQRKLISKLDLDGPWKKVMTGKCEVLSISSSYLEVLVHSSQESIFAIEISAKSCHTDSPENLIFSSVW